MVPRVDERPRIVRRVALPVCRRGRVADRVRIYERDGGRCKACGRDLHALVDEYNDRVAAAADAGAGMGEVMDWLTSLGFRPKRRLWEVDHVLPLWAGGSDDDSNKRTLCQPCHVDATRDGARWRRHAGRRKVAPVPSRAARRRDREAARGGRSAVGRAGGGAFSAPARDARPRGSFRSAPGCHGAGCRPAHAPAPSGFPRFRRVGVLVCQRCAREFSAHDLRCGKVPPHRAA